MDNMDNMGNMNNMNITNCEINDLAETAVMRLRASNGGLFGELLENAVSGSGSSAGTDGSDTLTELNKAALDSDLFLAISPKVELTEEIAAKVREMLISHGDSCRGGVVIVNRSGEVTRYCSKKRKTKDSPTQEELREVAKARARKKARLDAYFKLVERISFKRKLIEQENAKRGANKKYRYSVSRLELVARSILQKPSKEPEYYA